MPERIREVRQFQPAALGLPTLTLRTVAADATSAEFDGFATAYDVWYDVGGGPPYGWREIVMAGAGRRTLNTNPDVRLLVNHDGLPLARTRSGTLVLEELDQGLRALAPAIDLRNPLAQQVRSGMDRLDVDEMSFAFRVTRQEWNGDYTERRIIEYDLNVAGADVSIVTYPANPATVASMRSAIQIDELRATIVRPGLAASTARAALDQLRLSNR